MDTPVDQSVDVDMYDIDLFDNDQDVVAALQEQGRTVVCYVNAGGWENWRPDAAQFPDEVLGANLDDWEGERWLDIRRLDLLAPIMEARMDLCKAKGFDGIEPDNVDGYLNDTGFSLTYDDQLRYNIWWANAAHERGLSVGLKNDMDQISDLLPYFDWALNEQCFEYDECETLLPFIDAGKPVFHVEYELDTGQFCETANALNFNSLRKQLDLDAWRESCRNQADIRLTTSLDTVYYIVSGETTEEIFDSVKANGPDAEAQVEGRITAGLAESDRSYNFEYLDLGAYCELQSADINMRLVVTLPSHQDTSALSDIQLTRWQGFAEGVAIHEQHHVDIYTERIESFKNRLESLPEQFSNCDLLRSSIATAWELESALDEQEQAAFHQSEEQLSQSLRGPVQIQIDQNQLGLDELRDELASLSLQTEGLRVEIADIGRSAQPYRDQMDAIQLSYPDLILPTDVFEEYEALLAEWNSLNDLRNEIVRNPNLLVDLHNRTAEEFNASAELIARLQEDLAWLP